jgi:hypothetical protein
MTRQHRDVAGRPADLLIRSDAQKTDDDTDTEDHGALDMASVDADIAAGAKALRGLLRHVNDDWKRWAIITKGFRAMRNLAFAKAHTSDINSDAYKKMIGGMLKQKKYSMYDRIAGKKAKQVRSSLYKIMDRIEEIDIWYDTSVTVDEKERWKHPESIAKHAPKHLLAEARHNKAKRKDKQKPVSAEARRLRKLLLQAIERLMEHKIDARDLLAQVDPADPDDEISDLYHVVDQPLDPAEVAGCDLGDAPAVATAFSGG